MTRRTSLATPFTYLIAWVTLFTATVLEWRWAEESSFGGPHRCNVADLCDAPEAAGHLQAYTLVAAAAFCLLVVLELLRAIKSSPLSPEAEARRRLGVKVTDAGGAASRDTSVVPNPHWTLRDPSRRDPSRRQGPRVAFGVTIVAGISVVAACTIGFIFLAGALTWGALAGADAVVVLAFALARLNGAVLQAVWTWCPRRISVLVGFVTAVFAAVTGPPLFFTNGGDGRFAVLVLGCVAVLCVGAVWGRSMPRD